MSRAALNSPDDFGVNCPFKYFTSNWIDWGYHPQHYINTCLHKHTALPASFLSMSEASVSVAALPSGVWDSDGGSGLAPGPSGERAKPGSSCCPPLTSSTALWLWGATSNCLTGSSWAFWVASEESWNQDVWVWFDWTVNRLQQSSNYTQLMALNPSR